MATVQYDDGLNIEFQGNPTPQDIEEAHSQVSGSSDPVMQSLNNLSGSMSQAKLPQTQSPLNLADSVKFGLLAGDKKGQESLLRNKFSIVQDTGDGNYLVGNTPEELNKVNPDGLMNDIPAKLAQGIGTINTLTDSIIGATIGSAAGPVGAVGGSAVGAGIGTGINKMLGKAMGLNKQSPESLATDIALDSALYGAGEGIGQLFNGMLKASGPSIAAKGVELANSQLKDPALDAATRAKRTSFMANILNFGTGWGKDDATAAIVNGPKATFGTEESGPLKGIIKGSDEHMTNLVDRMKSTIETKDNELSQKVGVAAKNLKNSLNVEKAEDVDGVDFQRNIAKTLQDMGWATPGFTETTDAEGNIVRNDYIKLNVSKDDKEAYDLVNKMKAHFNAVGGTASDVDPNILYINPDSKMSLEQLFARRNVLKQQLDKSADDSLAKKAFAILKGGDNLSVDPKTGVKGIKGIEDGIADIATQVGDKDYLSSIDNLHNYRTMTNALDDSGLHWKNPKAIQETIKAGTEDNAVLKRALAAFDSSQGSDWSNQMAMWKSARSATNLNPNYLRFNFVMGLTGLAALKQDTMLGRLGYAGAGMALATPGGAKTMLMMAEKSGVLGKILGTTAKKAASSGVENSLIRRLITQSAAAGVRNKITSKSQ